MFAPNLLAQSDPELWNAIRLEHQRPPREVEILGFGVTSEVDPLGFVQKGTLPIIVSVPHGGKKPVPEVPERLGVGVKMFATVRDTNTSELAEKFVTVLEKQLGGKPWVVIARFERKYVDANRPPDGACGTR